jgi:hypothetical protein
MEQLPRRDGPQDGIGRDEQGIEFIDDLTHRLFELREKLNYFLITASTAVVVFTFNNLNSAQGTLGRASHILIAIGFGGMIGASGASLIVLYLRHSQYRRYLQIRYDGRVTPNEEELRQVRKAETLMLFWTGALAASFVVGMGFLSAAYVQGLTRR